MATSGFFILQDVYNALESGEWVTSAYVAAPPEVQYGWFGGGNNPAVPGAFSTVDRIDYVNDSTTASIRGSFSFPGYQGTATGNDSYGWFTRGVNGDSASQTTAVERVDYSNDLVVSSTRGTISAAKTQLGSTGNNNYGWIGGGLNPTATPSVVLSTVERIFYTNDLITASVRSPLSLARYEPAASGNNDYGWFGSGIPGPVSTVDRIEFANDLTTAIARGALTVISRGTSATGNNNYGWFAGGLTPSGRTSVVSRIEYINDAVTASSRGFLGEARGFSAASGNSSYGWVGGGNNTSTNSTVFRIEYMNDSNTATSRGPLSLSRLYLSATGGFPG